MYGQGPPPVVHPLVERNFGTLVYATDYSYGMPNNTGYPRTSKFRVDDQVLWVIVADNNGPVWVELEGD